MATAASSTPDVLDAALSYAARGWPVFPCNPGTKTPLTEHGFGDASADPATTRAWWSRWPHAMVAAPTGSAIGAFVLDVDDPAAFEAAAATLDLTLPATARSDTGKGYHLWFAWDGEQPIRNAQRHPKKGWPFPELPGAETRGEGGYVILPPSLHPSGRRYSWRRDEEPSEAPNELLAIIARAKAEAPKPAPQPVSWTVSDSSYGLAALDDECATITSAGGGTQESALNEAGLKVGGLVAGGELRIETARARLIAAGLGMMSYDARNPWTPQMVAAKVERALHDGAASPRSAPKRMAFSPVAGRQHQRGEADRREAANDDPDPSIRATPFVWRDPRSIPRRPWVFGHWMLRNTITALVAPGRQRCAQPAPE